MRKKTSSQETKISYTQAQIDEALMVLQENGGNISATSRQLGISRHYLKKWKNSEGLPEDLKDREYMFAHEYVIDFNAASAAIRSGHNLGSASKAGYRLMQNPRVKEKIREIMDERASHIKIDENRILEELASIAFSDITNYLEWDEGGNIELKDLSKLSASQWAAIQEIKVQTVGGNERVKIKLYDKMKALDLLSNLKMLKNRTEEKEDPNENREDIYRKIQEAVYKNYGYTKN